MDRQDESDPSERPGERATRNARANRIMCTESKVIVRALDDRFEVVGCRAEVGVCEMAGMFRPAYLALARGAAATLAGEMGVGVAVVEQIAAAHPTPAMTAAIVSQRFAAAGAGR